MPNGKVWLNTFCVIAAFGLLSNIILFNLDGFTRLNPTMNSNFEQPSAPPAGPIAVAQSLRELGIEPGDKVGVIGYAYEAYWARLAKVRITAEMLDADADELWDGDEALRQSVLQAFANSGVDAVVAEYVPGYANLQNWHQVDNSNYYIYVFAEQ